MTIKAYMDDSYLKEIKANVVLKVEKEGKYYLILDRTIFYPHLVGGQPRDKGTIEGVAVIDVYEENDNIVHVLEDDIYTDKVSLVIDWENRFDIMQQHTGQHLLSANLYSLYNAHTDSFHFGDDLVSINIDKECFSEKEARQVEFLTNKMILSNLKISSYYPNQEELLDMPIRKMPKTDKGEKVRIIEIAGLDYSPCCGTHLSSTGEIGLIKIKRWHSNNGVTKLDFLCGNRAIRDYREINNSIFDLTKILSTGQENVVDRTKFILDEKVKLEKQVKSLKEKLSKYRGDLLLQNASLHGDIRFVINRFKDEDFKSINWMSSYLSQKEDVIQIYSVEEDDSYKFIISRSDNLDIDLSSIFEEIKENLDVKGGGNKSSIQGATSSDLIDILLSRFYEKFKNILNID